MYTYTDIYIQRIHSCVSVRALAEIQQTIYNTLSVWRDVCLLREQRTQHKKSQIVYMLIFINTCHSPVQNSRIYTYILITTNIAQNHMPQRPKCHLSN